MHALFFEMRPKPGHLDHYFDHVARLRPVLDRHRGLVFLERYGSLSDPDLLLSHQLWDSEEAIAGWRADAQHRRSQTAGRTVHFADYRIRVGERIWHRAPGTATTESRADVAASRSCVLALYGTRPLTDGGLSAFESFTRKGRYISLGAFETPSRAHDVIARGELIGVDEMALYGIHRDYGQFDRSEAPD
ncbi:hypothetical protein OCH239_10375 [Roseivivax halodurans JCM 10272]|uniref:ABM domain-containing protein n=1 Tax=Roseivivax halodurans JCM 10272 TaxID=1449350 RepID=X7EBK0_9RHOB|nr:antibiotic biosynthesis monooxygenase [Roseivivax halodurans]ETX13444.1 hypothetical protein OCH239_10375 [Roseivivax halodurans JCM 10272]